VAGLFCRIRSAATGGDRVCSRCQGVVHTRRRYGAMWICKNCGYEFSVTAGTILADRKMSFGNLLLTIAGDLPVRQRGQGHASSPAVLRDRLRPKVAFVLLHKLRECLEADRHGISRVVRKPSARPTPPASEATASRPTIRKTAATCGWQRTRPASVNALSWCASAPAGQRRPSSRARRRDPCR
jgi:hypothetical protein